MFTNNYCGEVIKLYLCLHAYCTCTFMHMLGSDESWNKVPNEGYIGQVLLLHPKNTAPGIKGYVVIQARTPPINNLISSFMSVKNPMAYSTSLDSRSLSIDKDERGWDRG